MKSPSAFLYFIDWAFFYVKTYMHAQGIILKPKEDLVYQKKTFIPTVNGHYKYSWFSIWRRPSTIHVDYVFGHYSSDNYDITVKGKW